jgi:hypothetical protein
MLFIPVHSTNSQTTPKLVANIAKLNHPNLSELLDGYCSEHIQCLLAYAFYNIGCLHGLLHLPDGTARSLSWNSRVNIALGPATARALE